MWSALEKAIKDITVPDREILGLIKDALNKNPDIKFVKNNEYDEGNWWTANNMAKVINKSTTSVGTSCRNLTKAGYLIAKPVKAGGKWFKYQVSEKPNLSHSIIPSDFLPFFLPVGVTSIFGSTAHPFQGVWLNSVCVCDMPNLVSFFRDAHLYTQDLLICVYNIYIWVSAAEMPPLNPEKCSKLEDKYFSKFRDIAHIHTQHIYTPENSVRFEMSQQVLWKWSLELNLSNGAMEYQNLETSQKSPPTKVVDQTIDKAKIYREQMEKIIQIETGKLQPTEYGVEYVKIWDELRKIIKTDPNYDLFNQTLSDLSYDGVIYEPKSYIYKYATGL